MEHRWGRPRYFQSGPFCSSDYRVLIVLEGTSAEPVPLGAGHRSFDSFRMTFGALDHFSTIILTFFVMLNKTNFPPEQERIGERQ